MPVAIGLGSNLGDRAERLAEGVRGLAALLRDLTCSGVYETEPRDMAAGGDFLNMCCTGRTRLAPRALLDALMELERASGRRRDGSEGAGPASRTLDLDLLLYGDRVIEEPGLEVPHPRLAGRAFVLVPLAEIAPDWTHPLAGSSIREMAARTDRGGVEKYGGPVPDLPRGARPAEGSTSHGGDGSA